MRMIWRNSRAHKKVPLAGVDRKGIDGAWRSFQGLAEAAEAFTEGYSALRRHGRQVDGLERRVFLICAEG